VILGADELARGSAQLKDLRSREQIEVPRGELAAAAARALGRPLPDGAQASPQASLSDAP
jgi:hypothetical protein